MAYRRDIDGLRGIAILAVVLYHAKFSTFSGGFVGVDLFFVLSGFLVTSLLDKDENPSVRSVVSFYARRSARIVPALLFFLVIASIVGAVILTPDQFQYLGRNLLANSLFSGNIANYRMVYNYFSPQSDENPLLHLWSLSVEEQFYLFYPLLYVGLARFKKSGKVALIGFVTLVSLTLCELELHRPGQGAFFLTGYRAWEFSLGALVFLSKYSPPTRHQQLLSTLGITLVGFSIFHFNSETPFPGLVALIPCLGACFLLASPRSHIAKALSSKPLTALGLISFSLYLWHWAIFVFGHFSIPRALTPIDRIVLIAFAVGLSALSWRWVERPMRSWGNRLAPARTLSLAGCCLILLAVCAQSMRLSSGYLGRWQASLVPGLVNTALKYPPCPDLVCQYGNRSSPMETVLWGDSHGIALQEGVGQEMDSKRKSWGALGIGGCPPLLGIEVKAGNDLRNCAAQAQQRFEAIERAPSVKHVIVAARWAIYSEGARLGTELLPKVTLCEGARCAQSLEEQHALFQKGLRNTLQHLRAARKKVILVGPIPVPGWEVPNLFKLASILGPAFYPAFSLKQFEEREGFVLNSLSRSSYDFQITLLLPHQALCTEECATSVQGRALYRDNNHLSAFGATYLWDQLTESSKYRLSHRLLFGH